EAVVGVVVAQRLVHGVERRHHLFGARVAGACRRVQRLVCLQGADQRRDVASETAITDEVAGSVEARETADGDPAAICPGSLEPAYEVAERPARLQILQVSGGRTVTLEGLFQEIKTEATDHACRVNAGNGLIIV